MQEFVEREVCGAAYTTITRAKCRKGDSDEGNKKTGVGSETLHGVVYILGIYAENWNTLSGRSLPR